MKLKKILALVLCFAMVLSTMSFTVSAKPESPVAPDVEETETVEIAENGDVAVVNGTPYPTIQAAINAAGEGDTVTIAAGEYGAFNISGKKITIQGTVSDEGELLTTIKGGNPAITGHNFDGTIKNLKIADAWKAMYAEPVGNVTIDNVYVTGVTYGFHLVAYKTGITWTIQNSYMDLSWANSFGVYGGGYADIIIKNNKFDSTDPYYPDYGSLAVNTFSPSVTVEDNIFGEGAKIYVDAAAVPDTSNINIGANYYADGVENAFADDVEGVKVDIDTFYSEITENGEPTGLVDTAKTYIAFAKNENGTVTYYETVQAAIDAAEEGDNLIQLLPGTIDENVLITQNAGINITIQGQDGVVYKGIFDIDGNGRSNVDEWVKFYGIFFDGSDATAAQTFIKSERKYPIETTPQHYSYPHNVTVEKCDFLGTPDYDIQAVKWNGGSNLTIKDCTMNYGHSLLWANANTSASLIENVTVTNLGSGVSLGTNANYTLRNCNFSVAEHAVRADANSDRNVELTIEGCNFNAAEGIVVRNADSKNFDYGVTVSNSKIISSDVDITRAGAAAEGDTIFFTIDNNYWGGDAPTTPELTGFVNEVVAYYIDEDMTVIGGAAAEIDGVYYATLQDAIADLEDGDTLKIATGTYDAFEVLADNVTITGMTDDTEITLGSTTDTAFIGVGGDDVTIEDIKFIIPEEVAGGRVWLASVIGFASSQYNYGGVEPDGWDVIDCDFVQEGDALGIAIFNCNSFTVDGCAFVNFGTGITSMGDGSALGTVAITDNTFTKVDVPVNLYWGQTGDENGSLTITGNTFASAKTADEIKIAIDDYASRNAGTSGIDALDLSNNTFGAATEVELVDASVSVTEGVKEDLANAENVVIDERYAAIARVGDDKYFNSLEAAIAAAQTVDTIDLLGNTAEFPQAKVGKALTIANGTITLPTALTRAATEPTYWFVSDDITFENITLTGENYDTAGWGVFYLVAEGASVNFDNSTVNLKNDVSSGGGFIKGDVAGVSASFDNTDVYLENTKRGFNNLASLTLSKDTDFVLKGTTEDGMENAINKVGVLTVNDTSSIEIDGCFEYGIKMNDNFYVNDEAKVVVRNSSIADIMVRPEVTADTKLIVSDKAIVIADIITPEVLVEIEDDGEVIEKSENIYVQFKKVDLEANEEGIMEDSVEGSDKYEIILSGYKHNINRLTTADLTFKLDANPHANADMAYAIEPRAGITLTPHDADGYMFNFDGVTAPDETGENIVIGYVTISGYGNYTFSVAADNKEKGIENIVNATEVQDSIVDTFVVNGATNKGTLIINTKIENDDDMVGIIGSPDKVDIAVPVRTLKINVTFPNIVSDNAVAYQDMKVQITGNIDGVNQTITYNLGKGTDENDVAMVGGAYVFEEERLVLNESYTVTVSGAGYRTARYTVRMTDHKELKFWNNVMDEAQVIEIGNDSVVTVKNFLAGDIVKDNNINIYDLSAVVSYFGTEGLSATNHPEYAKYDLNRDNVIDSKDVAYVLVSWGN